MKQEPQQVAPVILPSDSVQQSLIVVIPENATLYRCDAGRSFYLRFLATGEAWVILPGREFRLDKVAADSGARYRGAGSMLDFKGADLAEATLDDGPASQFTGCRRNASG